MAKPSPKNKHSHSQLAIRELQGRPAIEAIFPLVKQVNPQLTIQGFSRCLDDMLARGYRCLGAYSGAKLIGACGLWQGSRFWCGKYMEVDNVVIDLRQRNKGIGKLLMDFAEKEAKRRGCNLVMADSYTYNHASHRFYFREGYIIKGFCFVNEL